MYHREEYRWNMKQIWDNNEIHIINFLKWRWFNVRELTDIKEAQFNEIDVIIEKDFNTYSCEIKSDKWISEDGNLCFEYHRVNCYNKWFRNHVGWGWNSKSDLLIIRNPNTNEIFIIPFSKLRRMVWFKRCLWIG